MEDEIPELSNTEVTHVTEEINETDETQSTNDEDHDQESTSKTSDYVIDIEPPKLSSDQSYTPRVNSILEPPQMNFEVAFKSMEQAMQKFDSGSTTTTTTTNSRTASPKQVQKSVVEPQKTGTGRVNIGNNTHAGSPPRSTPQVATSVLSGKSNLIPITSNQNHDQHTTTPATITPTDRGTLYENLDSTLLNLQKFLAKYQWGSKQ